MALLLISSRRPWPGSKEAANRRALAEHIAERVTQAVYPPDLEKTTKAVQQEWLGHVVAAAMSEWEARHGR